MAKDVCESHEKLKNILHKLDQPIMQMADQISTIKDRFDSKFIPVSRWRCSFFTGEERIKVFRWMSEIEYRSHHDEHSKDLLPGSGQWLIESRDFIKWGQLSVSSILWLHGMRK
jgi:hypothetical protein